MALRDVQARLQASFERFDESGTRQFGPHAVLRALRDYQPRLGNSTLRCIAVVLNTVDLQGDGQLSLKEVAQVG